MRNLHRDLRRILVLVATSVSSLAMAQGSDTSVFPETAAKVAVVMDAKTGAVLLDKNGTAPFPPASLAKIMTAEILFQAFQTEKLEPETLLPVSDHAWRTGGAPSRTATMFAAVRSQIPALAIARGLVVQAANDSAIILAEQLAGSEAAFAQRMSDRAKELGMVDSRFVNATGLPQAGQEVTARDMSLLARHVTSSYPQWYPLYAEAEFEWNKIRQRNRNPLLAAGIGATGMAAGFSEEGGYAIVGVFDQGGGRSTIVTLAGLDNEAARVREAANLSRWASSTFEEREVFAAQTPVARAPVFGGVEASVPLVLSDDLTAFVPTAQPQAISASVRYDTPLRAPVRKGDRIGVLELRIEGRFSLERDLFAADDVREGSFSSRAADAVQELAFGWVRSL